MAEYIERGVLLKAVEKMDRLDKETKTKYEYNKEGYILLLESAPAADVAPVVHAHWGNWGCQGTVCSNCHGRVLYECDEQEEKSKFCPHCGAQMDEVAGDTNVGSKTE